MTPAYKDNDFSGEDDDEANNKKQKRQQRIGSNPLADARKQQSKADYLWHRKSGAGVQLFVQYYAQQPIGCVATVASHNNNNNNNNADIVKDKHKPTTQSGAGLSRAAKKRKKRKACGTLVQIEPLDLVEPEKNGNVISEQEYDVSNSKLLKSWTLAPPCTKSLSGYNHLKPYLEALSKPLPLTFRIRTGCSTDVVETIQQDIQRNYGHLVKPHTFENSIYQALSCHLSKASLSKTSLSLKEFIVKNSANGKLARQELLSMLPVIGLARGGWLKANSRVLDICASPGSKALQALEIVGRKGRIVANDVHPTRVETLKAAVQRSGLSSELRARVIYTNFDAGVFPTPKNKKLFDAVICDVPCSGDGTIRKDKHILPLWTPATGNSLHSLQVRILMRAIHLVRVGGVVSYSTCSLNPIEDEAVVACVLSQMNKAHYSKQTIIEEIIPAVELIDFPELCGFVSRPGIQEWNVADYVGETDSDQDDDSVCLRWHATYQAALDANMVKAVSSMWAPSKKDANQLHLERCIRLWPQDQDTGGFFVALIRKNH